MLLMLLVMGCNTDDNRASESAPTNAPVTHAEVWLQVEGMTKVQGIT
jgi:hypothetical protein